MRYQEFLGQVNEWWEVKRALARGDKARARELFAAMLDAEHRAGNITNKQARSWVYPVSWD
jgi:hypothetical protein